MHNIGVLVGGRGRGSNLAALARATAVGQLDATISIVISPREDLPAVDTARELGLKVVVVEPEEQDYGHRLVQVLREEQCELVCLAGYMRLLPDEVLRAYPGRVLNIHPALLPKFGGKGMYGRRVHEAVIAAGEKESGCTVHLVNEVYDDGRILLQMKCPVYENDTAEALAERVLSLEHRAYPAAIKLLFENA